MVVSIRTFLKIAPLLVLTVFMSKLRAAEVECDYYSKSEWPSAQERVCQDSTVPPLPLFSDDETTFSLWPTCQSSSSDHDGDGWGWENSRSCRVDVAAAIPVTPEPIDVAPANAPTTADPAASVPTTSVATASELTASELGHTSCQYASSDPDGDGWGWENNDSCRVDNNTLSKICENASSDPDGDGWGWENNDSCRISAGTTQNVIVKTPDTTNSQVSDNETEIVAKANTPANTPANTAVNTPASGHPFCESAASDPDGDGWGWENNNSCIVGPDTAPNPDFTESETANGSSTTANPNVIADNSDNNAAESSTDNTQQSNKAPTSPNNAIIFQQDFETASAGTYTPEDLNTQWDTPLWHLGFKDGRANIITDLQNGKSLQITYPANKFGAGGASAFLSDLAFGIGIEGQYEELYLSYDMKFAEGFDFVRGGKLPGLCGYNYKQRPSDGCNTGGGYPSGYDGWSARGMWRVDGTLENYVYNANQESFYGDDEYWNVEAVPGQWHRVQHRVVLNTVGQKNGILEAWLDGVKVLSDNTVEYRKTEDIKINLFYFNTFYGGNDSSWAPSTDQFMYFDNFRISTQPVEDSSDFSSTLLQNDINQKTLSASGGGPFFAPALLLLALLRRRTA